MHWSISQKALKNKWNWHLHLGQEDEAANGASKKSQGIKGI